MSTTSDPTQWIKAQQSNGSGNCIEMRQAGEIVQIRDTKQNAQGPILDFTKAEFTAWIDDAKQGAFGHLLT